MKKLIGIMVVCILIAGCAVQKSDTAEKEHRKSMPDTPVASVLPPPEK